MSKTAHIQDLWQKRSVRWAILLASTLSIISASYVVYNGITYQKALDVQNPNGTPGPGSTASMGATLTTVLLMVALAFFIGFGLFLSIRGAYKRVSKPSAQEDPQPMTKESESEASTVVHDDEWEEAPKGSE